MKSNKEKVYDFIKMHETNKESKGLDTSYISTALNMQRTNVSSLLNMLVEEGLIVKSNGRPVLYSLNRGQISEIDSFCKLVGNEGSLRKITQLAKAALYYPENCLNCLIIGDRGTGKDMMAQCMYEYALEKRIIPLKTILYKVLCENYINDEENLIKDILNLRTQEIENETLIELDRTVFLYLENIQCLTNKSIRLVLERIRRDKRFVIIVASCNEKRHFLGEEYGREFPVILEMPSLADRPLKERMEMLHRFLSEESQLVQRRLRVKEDLMRCLLLYECEGNCLQLRGDIKIGCANAYVRELENKQEITLYISDFGRQVRKGFLRYQEYRTEIATVLPGNYDYTFDGEVAACERKDDENIYDKIGQKAIELKENGLSESEINLILSAEIERGFINYHRALVKDIDSVDKLTAVVDVEIVTLAKEFLSEGEKRLDKVFSENVLYGLCLHLKSVVNKNREVRRVEGNQLTEILTKFKKEYLLSAALAEKLSNKYDLDIPVEEIALIALFLCYDEPEVVSSGKPAILLAFYGEGVAVAIVNAVISITKQDNVYPFEVEYEKSSQEIYEELKIQLQRIHQGSGVFVLYDSNQIEEMLRELEEELGIVIRQLRIPVTTVGVELARKSLIENNIDKLYSEVTEREDLGIQKRKRYIVTLCTTGRGGAEELKRYIEKNGELADTIIIPMSMSNRNTIKEEFNRLLKKGSIYCVVGTFDPKLYGIPFLSVSEVFSAPKDKLPYILRFERRAKQAIDYEGVFSYLGEELEFTNIEKLRKVLPNTLKEINNKIKELPLDTEVGLLIHISCCINRLLGGEASVKNIRKQEIVSKYETSFNQLLKIMKNIEKVFGIIISDDEIANILIIIYQL